MALNGVYAELLKIQTPVEEPPKPPTPAGATTPLGAVTPTAPTQPAPIAA
jgi:hypothetical protein